MKGYFLFCLFAFVACSPPVTQKFDPLVEEREVGYTLPRTMVDLLFVIDNSHDAHRHQEALYNWGIDKILLQFSINKLPLPDIHMGTVSSDLGTAPHFVPSCEEPGGDGGILKQMRVGYEERNFLINISPIGCRISHPIDDLSMCEDHDCSQENCAAELFAEYGREESSDLILYEDESGCPRCLNYDMERQSDYIWNLINIGVAGCGFEQLLEAMKKSFEAQENLGFYRDGATLSLFFTSDEDDCSARTEDLFGPPYDLNSELGPFSNFRCTEFGVVCDQEWNRDISPNETMEFTGCHAREDSDPLSLLHGMERYYKAIEEHTGGRGAVISSLAAEPRDGMVTVHQDHNGYPMLGYAYHQSEPAVRLLEFVNNYRGKYPTEEVNGKYEDYYSPVYASHAKRIIEKNRGTCLPGILAGCPDIGYVTGRHASTKFPLHLAHACTPRCSLFFHGGTPIPACDSYIGTTTAQEVVPNLPVPFCYYFIDDPACDDVSQGAKIGIKRRSWSIPGEIQGTCKFYP